LIAAEPQIQKAWIAAFEKAMQEPEGAGPRR
jgi:hypothetical protein